MYRQISDLFLMRHSRTFKWRFRCSPKKNYGFMSFYFFSKFQKCWVGRAHTTTN